MTKPFIICGRADKGDKGVCALLFDPKGGKLGIAKRVYADNFTRLIAQTAPIGDDDRIAHGNLHGVG